MKDKVKKIITCVVIGIFFILMVVAYFNKGNFTNSAWALFPPIVAIVLALLTKEVYSSLFVGIIIGATLYSGFSFEGTLTHAFNDGIATVLSDSSNVGILVFLVVLGTIVCLMNQSGGSAAFGKWAQTHIKSRVGAQIATVLLGVAIFVDDYFNCLTVGSVMRPVTDKHKISRAKLAYLIDATAAPVCIIAPVSSWAAAVAGFAEDGQGLNLFIKAIPYNFYALLTIIMLITITVLKLDYGPMARFERNAIEKGDIFSGRNAFELAEKLTPNEKGRVIDLILPIVVLITSCIISMVYSGGYFEGNISFAKAFSKADASIGLMLGSAVALVIIIIYYLFRGLIPFTKMMESIPEGFKTMVPAILILTFAWTLKAMTDSLGAKFFVANVVDKYASSVDFLLPALVFVIGCLLAFATGTSWGTFGILIPIVQSVFEMNNPLAIICISACMAGAVCGDHCSPISDTTIMASAGAQCDHVNHVSTQLVYALTAATVSTFCYILSGVLAKHFDLGIIALPVGIVLIIGSMLAIKKITGKPKIENK